MRMTPLKRLAALGFLAIGTLFAGCEAQPIEAIDKGTGGLESCKPHDELPPPAIGAINGGACPALDADCTKEIPLYLCLDGERRKVLKCNTATKTWSVYLQECEGDGGTSG